MRKTCVYLKFTPLLASGVRCGLWSNLCIKSKINRVYHYATDYFMNGPTLYLIDVQNVFVAQAQNIITWQVKKFGSFKVVT